MLARVPEGLLGEEEPVVGECSFISDFEWFFSLTRVLISLAAYLICTIVGETSAK